MALQLDCCGWDGPKEFAYNSEPIDDSCYVNLDLNNSGVLARPDEDDFFSTKKMKQVTAVLIRKFICDGHATSFIMVALSQKAVEMQSKCSQNAVKMQSKCSQTSVKLQCNFSVTSV